MGWKTNSSQAALKTRPIQSATQWNQCGFMPIVVLHPGRFYIINDAPIALLITRDLHSRKLGVSVLKKDAVSVSHEAEQCWADRPAFNVLVLQ